MKDSRFKYGYRKNASKLHKTIGEILRTHESFKNYNSFQEYPVNKVNKNYQYSDHHFDWVIPTLKIVIECHGKQHYEAVNFGGMSNEDAVSAHTDTVYRDKLKKTAAQKAGYTYIEIPYTLQNKLTGELLLEFLNKEIKEDNEVDDGNQRQVDNSIQQSKKVFLRRQRDTYLESEKHRDNLQKARQRRHENYLNKKSIKETNRNK